MNSAKSELDSARKESAAKDSIISSKNEEIAKLKSQIESLKQNI